MAELKPCPFCGGKVEETGGSCNFGKKIMTLNVKCRKCGTSVALKTAWNTNAYIEAVEAWNRRVNDGKDTKEAETTQIIDGCCTACGAFMDCCEAADYKFCPYCAKRIV